MVTSLENPALTVEPDDSDIAADFSELETPEEEKKEEDKKRVARPSRRWVFTAWPEYTPEIDFSKWSALKYGCYGLEAAPTTGKKHYQAYVVFDRPVRLAHIRKCLGSAKFKAFPARGSHEQARDYCLREGDYKQKGGEFFGGSAFGNEKGLGEQGARTDLAKESEEYAGLIVDVWESTLSVQQICYKYPKFAVKYFANIRSMFERARCEGCAGKV